MFKNKVLWVILR